jgi:hypothetical protein
MQSLGFVVRHLLVSPSLTATQKAERATVLDELLRQLRSIENRS